MINTLKNFIKKYPQAWFGLYIPIYCIWFTSLEKWMDRNFTYLHCGLDDATPFVSLFIIPYYMWFPFVGLSCLYFFFWTKPSKCIQFFSAFITGMTITLIIYTIWPNALQLRPETLNEGSLLDSIVKKLYTVDTSTNVCPSLHVLNTLVIDVAFFKNGLHKKSTFITIFVSVLSFLIVLSTVFLKQHSWIDVFAAFALCAVLYLIFYKALDKKFK